MESRIDFFGSATAEKLIRHFSAAGTAVLDSPLPPVVADLVMLRSSQINGCSFCTDMHYKDAVHRGEDPVRLNMVAAWRETDVFTEEERAALALAESAARIADSDGVDDDVWAGVRKHFDDDQLSAMIGVIALINAYNRMNVIARTPGGSYTPGQFG